MIADEGLITEHVALKVQTNLLRFKVAVPDANSVFWASLHPWLFGARMVSTTPRTKSYEPISECLDIS